ncbi:MAG TPA: S9 family peptidase [Gammaproteobacteria bacterium]
MSSRSRPVLVFLLAASLLACERNAPDSTAASSPDASPPAQAPAEPPLLPRRLLFGNPQQTGGQVSPDGRWLGYLAPRDGVLNVYVAPREAPDAARPVTNDRLRGIRLFRFAHTGNHLLYAQDVGGDENFQVFAVDLTTGAETPLTPRGSRASIAALSPKHPDEVMIYVNDRDPVYFDVVRVNLATGEQTRVLENNEFAEVYVDRDFALRFAAKQTPDGGQELFIREGDGWQSWTTIPQEDALTTGFAGITADGNTIYMLDSRERNTGALFALDAETGERRLVHEDSRSDVLGAMVHPETGVVQAVLVVYLRNEWTVIEPAIAADLERLRAIGDGDVNVVSRALADDLWVVVHASSTAPPKYYLYDRESGETRLWFETRPELGDARTATMHTAEIPSRDGLTLPSYYTLPPGSDPDGDGKPDSPLPTVLLVHGGPWGRDGYGFNSMHQWLANRGYAVLAVNFRGSIGFGKDFTNAGDLEWGRKMHDDLLDGVAWAVREGIAQRDGVAIMGGSYGGYATLVGLAMTPTEFACGVDIVGPSNLITLLSSIPPYWGPIRTTFTTRMGDDATEEGRELLTERSPLTYAHQIQRPLLIGQGANDPRVKQAESDQIVAAMQANDIPVTYILFPDEGHGFARPQNNLAFNAAAEEFLATCLGGRVEPVGADLEGSSISVPTGAELLPGLQAALAATR